MTNLILGFSIGLTIGTTAALAAIHTQWRTFNNYDRGYNDGWDDAA